YRDIVRQQRRARGRHAATPFSVVALARTNSLVVSTTPSEFALVEHLIQSLDQTPVKAQRDVQVISLAHANPEDVPDKPEDLIAGRRRRDRPVIDADDMANTLTIIAGDSDLAMIRPVVAKLDKVAADHTIHIRVIPLSQGRAQTMADILRRVYAQTGQ